MIEGGAPSQKHEEAGRRFRDLVDKAVRPVDGTPGITSIIGENWLHVDNGTMVFRKYDTEIVEQQTEADPTHTIEVVLAESDGIARTSTLFELHQDATVHRRHIIFTEDDADIVVERSLSPFEVGAIVNYGTSPHTRPDQLPRSMSLSHDEHNYIQDELEQRDPRTPYHRLYKPSPWDTID